MQWLYFIPMFRPFVALFVGTILGYYLQIDSTLFLILSFSTLLSGIVLMNKKFSKIRWIAFSGICFLSALMFAGAYSYSFQKKVPLLEEGYYTYTAVVKKILSKKNDNTRAYIEIVSVKDFELKQPYKILATIRKKEVLPGDKIFASSFIKALALPSNTGQFDIKKYYEYKWIYQTTNIYPDNLIKAENYTGDYLLRWSYRASIWSSKTFKKYIPERSASTMQALLLGKKDDVRDDMKKVYMRAGVMHVLAVSGMHVGILYLGMLFLLKRFYRKRKWLSFIPISLIWVFAFVTGAGPAVLRAALMITFIDIGKKLNEQSNSVNLLFVAGFLLILFQPYLIWDIGFQLSFAAMLGILFLFKPIQDILYIKNKWVKDLIWTPSALSVSAQLATTPLSFFYFGNFPVLFLLTNIIILMPVTIAMYLGVGILLCANFLPASITLMIGKFLDIVLYYGFDLPLSWIVTLPGAYMDKIYLLPWQVFVLLSAVICFGRWMYQLKKGKWLIFSLILLTFSLLGTFFRQYQRSKMIEVNILQIPGAHAIAVNNFLWTDTHHQQQLIDSNDYFLSGFLRANSWNEWTFVQPEYVQADSQLITVGNKTFYILNDKLNQFQKGTKINVNYLILGNHFFLDVKLLKETFDFQHLILDGKLGYAKYNLFKSILRKENIDFIDTRKNGAIKILI